MRVMQYLINRVMLNYKDKDTNNQILIFNIKMLISIKMHKTH